jgi:hypothetical protein
MMVLAAVVFLVGALVYSLLKRREILAKGEQIPPSALISSWTHLMLSLQTVLLASAERLCTISAAEPSTQ